MGSASDEEAVQPTINTLESLGVDYEVRVMSAHRTPERVHEYASTARERGIEVIIAAAGGSAALGGASGRPDHVARHWNSADLKRTQRLGRAAFYRPDAARNTRRGYGCRRMGREERRVLCGPDPGHQARRHPRGRRTLPAIPS